MTKKIVQTAGRDTHAQNMAFDIGKPNDAFAQCFVGQSCLAPGVKHCHGAAPDSWFSHLAIEVPGQDTSNEWLEPVDNDAYGQLK